MKENILISILSSALISQLPAFADCTMDETAIIYALESSDEARSEEIDCVIDRLSDYPGVYPFEEAALGRAQVLRGIRGTFAMVNVYNQNKGFTQLRRAVDGNPDDFYAPMWSGVSAVESNYLFISEEAARDFLLGAIDVIMASDIEMRAYFLSYCYFYLGMLEKDTGDLKRALNYWELAIEVDPGGRMAGKASDFMDIFTG